MSELVELRAEKPPAAEGPFTDAAGNACLGVWADEGGMLLILQKVGWRMKFYAMDTEGNVMPGPVTLSSFRWARVAEFMVVDDE